MTFHAGRYRIRVDPGHLLFVCSVGGYCLWYLADTRAASTSVQNLLLIQPAVAVALLLVLAILPTVVSIERAAGPVTPAPQPAQAGSGRRLGDGLRILGLIALLGLYVLLMTDIGFDAATFLFVGGSLLLLGERRPSLVILLPLVFTALTVYGFKVMLSIPVPTLVI
ncbi:MAG TPA: tripartite tricarboxylate transporter TctB family protein [Thermodesulfobacteriota bacterium]